ncbi:MAG: serine--tRNA ligase [Rickettsiales bacterium]|jgi:seryl-tRNA synthetase|nr:serine--tRNA ligase [Rickettsiales bacterium]
MINLNWIIENTELFDTAMQKRGCEYRAKEIIELNDKRKKDLAELESFQQERNVISKEIGNLKAQKKDATELLKKADDVAKKMADLKEKQDNKEADKLYQILIRIPNILQDDLPIGGEDDYKVIKTWGEPTKFDFVPKPHYDLGVKLGMMDFEQAIQIHGARSTILLKDLAKLERALSNYFLDFLAKYDYVETSMPPLVKEDALFGTGQLPKFAEDAFKTTDGNWLIATSEITMTNWISNRIIEERELPIRFTAYTSCFRSEIGSAGKDVRGMLRQYHFKKVEMVSIISPDKSEEEHQRMVEIEDKILEGLKLPYRTIILATGDTGFGSSKTYDHEVWLPGQNKYREIASCSNCLDFQSRRMVGRYRDKSGKIVFPHTLNGSAMPLGRTIIAVMENYQQKDGSIVIPEVLVKYMGGQTIIK